MTKYNPTEHHVKVNTWGTKNKTSDGLDNFAELTLFGGNVGHASIEMTLPINKENKKLIETYCFEHTFNEFKTLQKTTMTWEEYMVLCPRRIPVKEIKHRTAQGKLNDDGTVEKTDKAAYETKFYKIEFSWWPAVTKSFYLSDMEQDMKDEREGKHFEYSDQAKEFLQPEERFHNGKLGGQLMTYAPASTAHQRDLSDAQMKKIGLHMQLDKVKEQLNTRELLDSKIDVLKGTKVGVTLKLICKNIGIDEKKLIAKYLESHPDKGNLDDFKQYFKEKVNKHMEDLAAKKVYLKTKLNKMRMIDVNDVGSDYMVEGVPPDHTITLPYLTDKSRGLSPEAMLRKMRELTESEAKEFNLHTNNCSNTTTAVLSAGASHDPLLQRTLGEQALDFFGTPQHVLGNAQRAKDIIVNNKENTFLRQIGNINVLDRAMGRLMKVVMDSDASKFKKGLAGIAMLPVVVAKIPRSAVKAFLNPTETMSNITSAIATVNKNANSLIVKILVATVSAIPLVILAPFALVEQGLKLIAKPFQPLGNWFIKIINEQAQALKNPMTVPLPSLNDEKFRNESYNSMMDRFVDEKVAAAINVNTNEVKKSKSPMDILTDFELALENNDDKVITLSDKDFDSLNKFVSAKKDPQITERFQACCNESLKRANNLSSQTRLDVERKTVRYRISKLEEFLKDANNNDSKVTGREYLIDFLRNNQDKFDILMANLPEDKKAQFIKDMQPIQDPGIVGGVKANVFNVLSWLTSPVITVSRAIAPSITESISSSMPATQDSHCKAQLKKLISETLDDLRLNQEEVIDRAAQEYFAPIAEEAARSALSMKG